MPCSDGRYNCIPFLQKKEAKNGKTEVILFGAGVGDSIDVQKHCKPMNAPMPSASDTQPASP
jgi:hypothetical protein